MTRTISRILVIAGLACLLIVPTAHAQLAQVDMGGGDILLHPNLGAAEWTLTVSTPEGTVVQTFAGDETPGFALRSVAGTDGVYQWELVRTPAFSASQIEAMAEARAQGVELKNGSEVGPVRQSGSFMVAGGAIVTEALVETPSPALTSAGAGTAGSGTATAGSGTATKDQVIADDLIVDGSACVGMDCVNGENFGFDTFRLKENNLRIHFDDTSNSSSFPANDWRIVANDSANGGASYLAIEDSTAGRTPFRVEAGAKNNMMVIDSANRIGMGTQTPAVLMHSVDGNTPTLRLEQDGSAGFQAQTWDIAGNEANFFVRDVTNGSLLPFRIKPGAPKDSIFVKANGDVGFGTDNPGHDLHIKKSNEAATDVQFMIQANTGPAFDFAADDTGVTWRFVNFDSSLFIVDNADLSQEEFQLYPNGDLAIYGDLYTNGTDPMPDYVFEADYDLMDLDSLSSFIDENGHLPKIASAQDVKEAGRINMSDLQLQLLEKVEELTLYTIAQHEQIGTQDQVIQELRTEKQELMERLERLEQMISGR